MVLSVHLGGRGSHVEQLAVERRSRGNYIVRDLKAEASPQPVSRSALTSHRPGVALVLHVLALGLLLRNWVLELADDAALFVRSDCVSTDVDPLCHRPLCTCAGTCMQCCVRQKMPASIDCLCLQQQEVTGGIALHSIAHSTAVRAVHADCSCQHLQFTFDDWARPMHAPLLKGAIWLDAVEQDSCSAQTCRQGSSRGSNISLANGSPRWQG